MAKPKRIPKWVSERYDTLVEAMRDPGEKRVCLFSALRKSDNAQVYLCCAVNYGAGGVEIVPFAEMITAPDPFEAYDPCV